MSQPGLLQWQWQGYPRYHRSRFNLLLHIVLVPLFLAGNVLFVVNLARSAWLPAAAGLLLTIVAIALQGTGHKREPTPPEPFTSPLNAISRIFAEQWLTFPRFVLSGAWWRALRAAAR